MVALRQSCLKAVTTKESSFRSKCGVNVIVTDVSVIKPNCEASRMNFPFKMTEQVSTMKQHDLTTRSVMQVFLLDPGLVG